MAFVDVLKFPAIIATNRTELTHYREGYHVAGWLYRPCF
jgi:hypothetical protein